MGIESTDADGRQDTARATNVDGDENGVHGSLSNPLRRDIVEMVARHDGVGLRYLALRIRSKEANRQEIPLTKIGYDHMRDEIEQTHLPVLVAAGVIRYNDETEWIELEEDSPESIESDRAGSN